MTTWPGHAIQGTSLYIKTLTTDSTIPSGIPHSTITIADNDTTTKESIVSINYGACIVSITNAATGGSCGVFAVLRSSISTDGLITKILGIPGPQDEEIWVCWDAGVDSLRCYHTVARTGGTGALLTYHVTVLTYWAS